ncbi:MAG: oligosaccharide flippase family protein [Pseudomonadota bacterium]|nr:oligosaccharide flippase family protein [Pseudomonadota bacterium]
MNAKKILHFSFGPVGAAFLGFITLPIVAWFFSLEDVGRLTMLQVVISLSITLFSLAMHQAYVREYNEEKNKFVLLKVVLLPGSMVLVLVILVFVLLPVSISDLFFGIDSNFLTFCLILGVVAAFFINFLSHVLRMQERGLAFSATQIMPKAILLVLIGCLILFNLPNDFQSLMLMNTVAIVSSLLLFSWLTKDSWLPAIYASTDAALLKKLLRFSLPLVVGSLAYWGLTTMDRFFLSALTGFEELGVYSMAVSLAAGVSVVSVVFSNLWHPVIYKWVKEGVEQKRVQAVIENMFLGVVFIWTMVGLFSWVLLYLLPDEYVAVEYLIIACVAMPLFYMLSETTVVGIGIARKTGYSMLASILAFVVNGILNYLFIPEYGASGAALATVLAFFVFFVVRTEASSYLWLSLPRFKIYFLCIAYVTLTIVIVLNKASQSYFFIIWLILFSLTVLFFFRRVSESFSYLKNIKGSEL